MVIASGVSIATTDMIHVSLVVIIATSANSEKTNVSVEFFSNALSSKSAKETLERRNNDSCIAYRPKYRIDGEKRRRKKIGINGL